MKIIQYDQVVDQYKAKLSRQDKLFNYSGHKYKQTSKFWRRTMKILTSVHGHRAIEVLNP